MNSPLSLILPGKVEVDLANFEILDKILIYWIFTKITASC